MARLRDEIDKLDAQLVKLLSRRAQHAIDIGNIKLILKLEAYSPRREEEVMRHVIALNKGPLSVQSVRRLFERIIDESRTLEKGRMLNGKPKQGKT